MKSVIVLDANKLDFPKVDLADADGFLCIGGDLSPERLQLAYSLGIFPWFMPNEPIIWYAPPYRCVIFPEEIKISKSLRQILNQKKFRVSKNTCFEHVIHLCAAIKRKDSWDTWITDQMIRAYIDLHQLQLAHSYEVWNADGDLVGGLYGVQHGRIFCGESMFSLESNASKIALVSLANDGFKLIDCQIENPHLIRMGARMIGMQAYQQFLK